MSKKKYFLSRTGIEILRILMEVTRIARSGESVQKVFNCIFNGGKFQTIFKFTKVYLAQLDENYKKYKIHALGGKWSETSEQKLWKFMGPSGWRRIEKGKLYRIILGREDPWKPLLIPDFKNSSIILDKYKEILEIKSAIASLIVIDNKRRGIILIGFSKKHEEDMLELSEILIGQVDLAGKTNYFRTAEELNLMRWHIDVHYKEAIKLSTSLEELDRITSHDVYKHSIRVAHVCFVIGRRMEMNSKWLIYLLTCAMLHDYGKRLILESLAHEKIKEPDRILKDMLIQHPEYSIEAAWNEYSKIDENFIWALPLLCHHCSPNPKASQPRKVTYLRTEEIMKKIKIKNEKLYEQLKKHKQAWLNNEIIRVADAIEDDVIDRLHRAKPEDVRVRIPRILNQKKYFAPEVLNALRKGTSDIIKIYDKEPKKPPTVDTLLLLESKIKKQGSLG